MSLLSLDLMAGLAASVDYFIHLVIVLVPLFIGASFIVGLIRRYLPPERVERILRKHDGGSGNVIAAVFGSVTPFCSCSTVPILAGLLQAGAPLGIVFSFLLGSPLVSMIAIAILLGLFGFKVTALYVVISFTAAVIGGLIIGRLRLGTHVKDVQSMTGQPIADGGTTTCCEATTPQRTSHRENLVAAGHEAVSFFREMVPYLLLGMVLGALIHGVVPVSWLITVFGPENPLAVPIAAIAGAPIYVSLEAMLPIAASLASQGIPIGTVLAFVVGSAGVSIPNVILLSKLFDRTLLAVYTAVVVLTGIVMGLVFNALFFF